MNRSEVLGPTFTTPTEPDVRPIIAMHRGNDGWVAFQRRTHAGQFQRGMSARASELSEVFPQFIAPHVDEESYFSINSMHLTARQRQWLSKIDPKFPQAQWGTSMLRHLTANYIDLDCYKLGLTVGQCVGMIIDAQDRGDVPPASLITRSGRGVWVFWFLQGDEGPGPVRAWPESISTYRRIERKLLYTFAKYGADPKSIDPARITRVPGSLHRSAGVRVDYWVQYDHHQRPITYTLDGLAVRMGVRPTKYSPSIAKVVDPKLSERGRKGHRALHAQRLDKLLRVFAERGKIYEGCRNHALFLLVCFMRGCKIDPVEIEKSAWAFGVSQCIPPLKPSEIESALGQGTGLNIAEGAAGRNRRRDAYKFTNYTIADWLGITPAESESTGWPAAGTRPIEADAILRTRADRTITRRELLQKFIVNRGGEVPTLAQCMEVIERLMGTRPSTKTMRADLIALGIENPRARRERGTDGPMLMGT